MRERADIINRFDEQQFLLRFFNACLGKKKVLILHSGAGVGKSYLVDHVISQVEERFTCVVMGRSTKYDGATYIQQMAATLNDNAEQTGDLPTLAQFCGILQSEKPDLALQFIQESFEPLEGIATRNPTLEVAKKLTALARGALSYFVPSDTPTNEILKSNNSDAISICERYVRHVVERRNIVVRINKYNEIDELSDRLLRHIYDTSNAITIILEITDKGKLGDAMNVRIEIDERFPGGVEYHRIYSVGINHILDHYRSMQATQNKQLDAYIERIFVSSKGNFRQFELLLRDGVSKELYKKALISSETHMVTLAREMPRDCKRILALACVMPLRVEIQTIQSVWDQNSWSSEGDFLSALALLKSEYRALLYIDDESVSLIDDIIKNYFLQSPLLEAFHIEARKVLLSALRQENLDSITPTGRKYLNTIAIISLVIQGQGSGDDSLLISSLRELNLLSYPSNKTELSKAIIKLYYEHIYKSRQSASNPSEIAVFDRVYEEICKILYRIGDLEALDQISNSYFGFFPLKDHNTYLRLTLISAKILIGDKRALGYLEAIDREDRDLYIGSRLLLIMYYRTFDFSGKAKREWRKLRKSEELRGSRFEGLLYEYGALTCPINIFKKIRLLKKAKARHLFHENHFHTVSCGLGISSTILYLPFFKSRKTKLAKDELASISALLPKVRIMDHILENQTAILEIHSGDWQRGTWENLKYAYDICALAADKLLIGANLVNCFIELRRKGVNVPNVSVYVEDILSITRRYQNRNSEFARYALSSCYRYFRFMDDRPMMRKLRDEDLGNMSMQLSIVNLGKPNTAVSKYFVKLIYSNIYRNIWPKIMPVYNWSTDFYSFR